MALQRRVAGILFLILPKVQRLFLLSYYSNVTVLFHNYFCGDYSGWCRRMIDANGVCLIRWPNQQRRNAAVTNVASTIRDYGGDGNYRENIILPILCPDGDAMAAFKMGLRRGKKREVDIPHRVRQSRPPA